MAVVVRKWPLAITLIAIAVVSFLWLRVVVNSHHVGPYEDHHVASRHHDEVNMPGLFGDNASAEESSDIGELFRHFQTLSRSVELLPNGIKTITRSSDPEVMTVLVRHASMMIERVAELNDPQIRIQSPTLDVFFKRGDRIDSKINLTESGLVVIQTSDDPELITALHEHAAEVSAMADRGMSAVHDMMAAQGRIHSH